MHPIYTAGYSAGWTVATLKAELERLNATLVDIRLSPRSRRHEWNKAALLAALGPRRYEWLPSLGNVNYATGGPIALQAPAHAVTPIASLLSLGPVVLLCACRDAQACHRSDAAAYLAERLGNPVAHLDPPVAPAPSGLKVITLTQPWATLVALGAKRIETRSWATSYRGPIAIHAAKGLADLGGERGLAALCAREPFRAALLAGGVTSAQQLPRGAIVAVAELVDCVPTAQLDGAEIGRFTHEGAPVLWVLTPQERTFGDYSPGRYGWLLDGVRALPEPIPARGTLGLWDLPEDVAAQLSAVAR